MKVPTDQLAVKGACALALRQGRSRRTPRRPGRADAATDIGDTIVLSTADDQGNMVAWVNSNFSASARA